MPSDVGQYQGLMNALLAQQPPQLSYLARDWPEIDQWRLEGRGKLLELLAFRPEPSPLDARSHGKRRLAGRDADLELEEVSWSLGYGPRAHAWVLRPAGTTGRLPGVLALHDHGGFKWFGKEKIASDGRDYPLTAEHKQRAYGGLSWANELARQGFVVLVHDVFPFGTRRVEMGELTPRLRQKLEGLAPNSPEFIRAYNTFASDHEHLLAKTFFTVGSTWPGVFAYEDRRAVDYLVSRGDVDAGRIGCGGLSGGGLRTVLLAGTEPRIHAAVCVGFMSTWQDFARDRVFTHTWMLYIPHCARFLDFPDIAALHGPRPLMVQYDEEDPLYSLQGQRDADRRLRAIYKKMKAEERYEGRFYPGPHKFDAPMQAEAWAFLKRHLT